MGELQQYVQKIGRRAREASRFLARTSTAKKDDALRFMASEIAKNEDVLLAANARDVARARQDNLEEALIDRLSLTPINIKGMIEGLEQIADLPDPIGEIDGLHYRPTGIQVGRMRVPLGVIGIIYESRPNVTADAAGLCLKAGNSAILRGGSEAIHSNQAIAACVKEGLKRAGLPEDAVQVIDVVDREVVSHLVKMTEFVDVIVPRGGKGLIEMISRESAIPVIKHLHGVCHVYIDAFADIDKAVQIADNAKTQRYGTCNTMESLLVHTSVAGDVLKKLAPIYLAKQVELRGDKRACSLVPAMTQASQEDWVTEYLAPILSIKVVDSLDEAIDHINAFGSHHTDAIVTDHFGHAQRFLTEVDSSSVMVNASTRFADGFEYGLGAEIGISTDKIHARGPVGLEGLTSQKYIVIGDGHIRG